MKHKINDSPIICEWSLPSRERGLKPDTAGVNWHNTQSLPSRERGLKLDADGTDARMRKPVAPFTGAWIETIQPNLLVVPPSLVAPFTGAWIET